MYLAYQLPDDTRRALLARFPPAPGMEAVCDHITYAFDPKTAPDAVLGERPEVLVIGRFTDALNDVLAVSVNGGVERRDGSLYHITLGVDRAAGGKPVRSNELVKAAFAAGGAAALRTLPAPIPAPGCELVRKERSSAAAPAAPKAAAAKPEAAITDLGDGVRREDTATGKESRARFVARGDDGKDVTLGIRVTNTASGAVTVDKGVYGGADSAEAAVALWRAERVPGRAPR